MTCSNSSKIRSRSFSAIPTPLSATCSAIQSVPEFDAGTRRKVRMLIHIELTLLFVIMLMAVMMARGVWYLGG